MKLTVEQLDFSIVKVNLVGRLDIAGAAAVDLPFSVLAGAHRRLIVDLAGVEVLAFIGVRTLVTGARTVLLRKGRMVFLRPLPAIESVLAESAADTLVPVLHDLDAAIAAVRGVEQPAAIREPASSDPIRLRS
jgi:anti-sigma B factor antagonist